MIDPGARFVIRLWLLSALGSVELGCGRIGFDPAQLDATTGTIETRFGERPTSTITGVTIDTEIDQGSPTTPEDGSTVDIDVNPNTQNGLLRFEVSAIQPGTAIAHVELLVHTEVGNVSVASLLVFELLEPWNEGTATWEEREQGKRWITAGANIPSRGAVVVGEIFAMGADTEYSTEVPVSLVQRWVDMPVQNFGLILVNSQTDDISLVSSEGAPNARPELRVLHQP